MAVDLVDDPAAQDEYQPLHQQVPAQVEDDLRRSGIQVLTTYGLGPRLFMIVEVPDGFEFAAQPGREVDPAVRRWDNLMATLQRPLPGGRAGQIWREPGELYGFRADSGGDPAGG